MNEADNCGNCRFAKPVEDGLDCRCNPPTPVYDDSGDGDVRGYWPKVDSDSWCGQWQRRAYHE